MPEGTSGSVRASWDLVGCFDTAGSLLHRSLDGIATSNGTITVIAAASSLKHRARGLRAAPSATDGERRLAGAVRAGLHRRDGHTQVLRDLRFGAALGVALPEHGRVLDAERGNR